MARIFRVKRGWALAFLQLLTTLFGAHVALVWGPWRGDKKPATYGVVSVSEDQR